MSREEQLKERMTATMDASDDPLEKLAAACLSRGYSGILALGRIFRRHDKNKSWTLSRAEIESAIQEFRLVFTKQQFNSMFEQIDTDDNGAVNYEEFLDAIRPPMSDPRKEAVAMAFNQLDVTGDGLVNIDDVRSKYSSSNHPAVLGKQQSEEDVVLRFLGRFENNIADDGMMTKAEFFDYYTGVSKSIDDDDYFVEMMKNVWGV